MSLKLGGWARIWIVSSGLFAAFGTWVALGNYTSATNAVDEEYQKASTPIMPDWADEHGVKSLKEECDIAVKKNPRTTYTQFICDAASSELSSIRDAAKTRDAKRATALHDAWRTGVLLGGLPSMAFALLLLSIGWVRDGFRKSPTVPKNEQ
jgi:hypothetical protein